MADHHQAARSPQEGGHVPVPFGYENATTEFQLFLRDARDAAGLVTTNQSFTMVEGVLRAFRRRLSVRDAIAFADVLPAIPRAIFVSHWDLDEPRRAFGDRAQLVAEARALRHDHNFSPDTCIEDVAGALRKHIDQAAFDRVLARLPAGAAEFWDPDPPHPHHRQEFLS
jgi:uncharacterized protein (DUF2267 family)